MMNDPYPQEFEVVLERDKLCRYLRLRAILSWFSLLPVIGAIFGFTAGLGKLNQYYLAVSMSDYFLPLSVGVGIGVTVGLILGLILYFVINHRSARQNADSLEVAVEGQFLRVTEGVMFRRDRKLHFRAIVDFACFQGPLMRWCDVTGITMNTTAGGLNTIVNVLAVKDAMSVRDTLSKIDRIREDQEPS